MIIKTLEEVQEYIQKEYWESGKSLNKSGYEKFFIDWHWNDRLTECLNQAFQLKNKKILDLGCAYGQVVASCLKKGYDTYGIDLSDYAIEQGQKEYPPLVNKIIQGSGHNLSKYPDNNFDFIYSQQVFEHIPRNLCEDLAKETYRVAKPKAIIWIGLVLDMNNEFQPQGYNPKDLDKTHINLRPRTWWDRKMTKAGWKIDIEPDKRFRATKLPDEYSFFEEYGWHSICYRKIK